MYSVIQYSSLLPPNQENPAEYPDGATLTLERDSTVEDICDFIVEYINSDVLVCPVFSQAPLSSHISIRAFCPIVFWLSPVGFLYVSADAKTYSFPQDQSKACPTSRYSSEMLTLLQGGHV